MIKGLLSGFSVIAMLALAAGAAAQEPEEAAREEASRALVGDEDINYRSTRFGAVLIPFERVLRAPNDEALNLAYARERIEMGDMKEASATLERMLLINPNLHEARLLYGFVLYRLEMYDRARFELEKALADGEGRLAPTVVAEAKVYLERIKRLQQKTRLFGSLAIGAEYNSNQNQSTSTGQLLFIDIPLQGGQRIDDVAYIISAQGKVERKLGGQDDNTLHAQASYYRSDKFDVDQLDLDAVSVAAGGTWNFDDISVTPRGRLTHYWLAGENYLLSYGGDLNVVWLFNPKLRYYVNFRGEHEEFSNTSSFGVAELRTGRRLTARAGANWRVNPRIAYNLEGLYVNKNGQLDVPSSMLTGNAEFSQSYDRYGVNLQQTWLHGRGVYTSLGGWAERTEYDGIDAFISPTTLREEWLYRGRASVGAPVSRLIGRYTPIIDDINIVLQYEYETVDSSLPNFEYNAHKVSLLFSKRFGS